MAAGGGQSTVVPAPPSGGALRSPGAGSKDEKHRPLPLQSSQLRGRRRDKYVTAVVHSAKANPASWECRWVEGRLPGGGASWELLGVCHLPPLLLAIPTQPHREVWPFISGLCPWICNLQGWPRCRESRIEVEGAGAEGTHSYWAPAAAAKSLQSCPTLCDPIDGSPSGSPVPGILQARTLEWVATSFSNAWKWKVKVKSLSRVWPLATPWIAAHQAPPSVGFSRQEYWSGLLLPSPKGTQNIDCFRLSHFSLAVTCGLPKR